MENIKEILKTSGVTATDEQLKAIEDSVIENYKTIKDYDNQAERLRNAEQKNTDTQKVLDDFKKNYEGVDVEELKGNIKTLNETLEQKETEYKKSEAKRSLMELAKKKAQDHKCIDFDLASARIDFDTLLESKNQGDDIDSFFKSLKGDKPILFESEKSQEGQKINVIPPTGGKTNENADSLKSALTEFYKGGN